MRYLILILIILLVFSCKNKGSERKNPKSITLTLKELCTKLNTEFIKEVKKLKICKDDDCGIAEHETWFNTKNYCNTKFNSITTKETEATDICLSYLFKIKSTCEDNSCLTATVTKEEIKGYMKKELEDLNATCRGFFNTNPFERCKSDHQSYLEVWKVQCNPTEKEIQEYLTKTAGRCTRISVNAECNGIVINGWSFGPIENSCKNFENTYSSWITNPNKYSCF